MPNLGGLATTTSMRETVSVSVSTGQGQGRNGVTIQIKGFGPVAQTCSCAQVQSQDGGKGSVLSSLVHIDTSDEDLVPLQLCARFCQTVSRSSLGC